MRIRSAIILIEDNKLALIERHRAEKHYFSFPGGGVDEGESPQEAAIREAGEELGIQVAIKQKVADVIFNGNPQYYFLAQKLSGEFGTGAGEEYGEFNPAHGTYHPICRTTMSCRVNWQSWLSVQRKKAGRRSQL